MTSYWTFFPKAFCRRCFIRFIARGVMSMPIHRRFSFWAAEIVVPQPRKGSSTTPPSGHEQRMIRSKSATGFWVGYPKHSPPHVQNQSIFSSPYFEPRLLSTLQVASAYENRPIRFCASSKIFPSSCLLNF